MFEGEMARKKLREEKKREKREQERARGKRRLAARRQAAEAKVRAGGWFIYINPVIGGPELNVDRRLVGLMGERGVDFGDGCQALLTIYRNAPRPAQNPAQMEYHFRSHWTANPLNGVTVHLLTLDSQVYVSTDRFFEYPK